MNYSRAVKLYRNVRVETEVAQATPYQLITLLLDGLLEKVSAAIGAAERSDDALRGESISSALGMINALRSSVDRQQGAEIADNLVFLYDYMDQQLLQASIERDKALMEEVHRLVSEVRSGWVALAIEP